MERLLNCPNCGAPVTGEKCAYCGTVFLDFAAIQVGAPSFVKFKMGEQYILARLVVDSLDIRCETQTADYYSDHIVLGSVVTGVGCHFSMEAHAVMAPGERSLVTVVVPE